MPDSTILALVQIFLLAMIVVGAAVKEVSRDLGPDASALAGITSLAITIITWIILTVLVLMTLAALAYGALLAWVYFAQR